MANCSNLTNTASVTINADSDNFPSNFCHSSMATTYAQFFDATITTASITGTTFVTTDDTPLSSQQGLVWLKQGGTSENCMPKGWYIYDSDMSTSDKWRNFMSTPAGSITMFGGSTSPEGWLLCDGTAYSTSTHPEYEDLYAAIQNAYGGSDGTDFQVPNLKGRMPVGLDSGQTEFDAMGETGGSKTHTLTEAEMPEHQHQIGVNSQNYVDAGTNQILGSNNGYDGYALNPASGIQGCSKVGGGDAHENMPPFLVVNYIIKY